jgi:phytoene synthase
MTVTLADAYAECEAITRREARNFAYGIRLLPADKRTALSAVYALARRIDDIGDGDLPVAEKLAALAAVRAELAAADQSDDRVIRAVHDAALRVPIPMSAFDELVDGVEMDVRGTTYATFSDLVGYCRCVAGSIGRLCVGVFGAADLDRAVVHADALGIALQQINILRDVREDLMAGRVYLPADELARYGVRLSIGPDGTLRGNGLEQLVIAASVRAAEWYADGMRLLPLLDRRSAACVSAMAGIYRRLLDRIAAQPELVRDRRLSLSAREKTVVAARALAGRRS